MEQTKTSPLNLMSLAILITLLAGCTTTQSKFGTAQKADTVSAYRAFLREHSTGHLADAAKRRIEELQYAKVKKMNTIYAYQAFIRKSTHPQLIADAEEQITRIRAANRRALQEEQAAFVSSRDSNSVVELTAFLKKYPKTKYKPQVQQILERLRFEAASADGSSRALRQFLAQYPKSQYTRKVREKLAEAAFAEATDAATDSALMAFIEEFGDSSLVNSAVKKLKTYESVPTRRSIPWRSIPNVRAGEASDGASGERYTCGINQNAFSIQPRVVCRKMTLVAGPLRFFKPDTATLVFSRWTEFDGYTAKGNAIISTQGLIFDRKSIVLKKRND